MPLLFTTYELYTILVKEIANHEEKRSQPMKNTNSNKKTYDFFFLYLFFKKNIKVSDFDYLQT